MLWPLAISHVLLAVPRASAQLDDADCLWCHGDPTIVERSPEELAAMVRVVEGRRVLRPANRIGDLYVPESDIAQSAHADVACASCHHVPANPPHGQRLPAVVCGDCHREVVEAIARGPHSPEAAIDGRQRPACSSCHGPAHRIPRAGERTHAQAVRSVETCATCHDERDGSGEPAPASGYRDNVHGRGLYILGLSRTAICTDCHGTHAMLPPSDPASPVHPLRVPETCGRCHEGVAEVYLSSVHGQHVVRGETSAACTSCHSSHGIGRVDDPFVRSVIDECSHCHLELGRTYLTSYHGKATTLGGSRAAVCSSCHGDHDILPPSDPRSRLHADNLQATCGKCHAHTNENFVEFITHVDHRDRENHPTVYYTWLVMTTLLLSVLALFVPHSLLWFLRESVERLRRPGPGRRRAPEGERWIERFRPIHRWTHFLIVISFMGLVLTGFPLKYSYTDWAKTVTGWLGGVETMGLLHRIFAVLTFGYAGMHLGFLIYSLCRKPRRPRRSLREILFGPDSMVFSLRDLRDFWSMLKWFLFIGSRPRFDRWTYFEKFDYWGEIWGIVVIGGTGLMLWMPTFFTSFLPGWVLNCALVVHSIEALLAASVIFLVHFLNTHLRPDKFPVDMVMFTGQLSESEMKHERPIEYERLLASGELEKRIVPRTRLKWRIVGTILGIAAFLLGLALIGLAMVTEIGGVLG